MIVDPAERDDRLARLGTSWPILERVIRAGEAGWRRATPNHGAGSASDYAYRERLAVLREEQKAHFGWENARLLQIELTVNPERTVAIQTLLGDRNTGNPTERPRNEHPRGENGRLLLNQGGDEQLELFPVERARDSAGEVTLSVLEDLQVWTLLVHRVAGPGPQGVIWHSELSRPHPPDERGYIPGWFERVPLPAVAIGAVVFPGEDEGPDGIDIPIAFR